MTEQLTKRKIRNMIFAEPAEKRKAKRIARDIAAAGSYDSRLEIQNQLRRRHSVNGRGEHVPRGMFRAPFIEWLPQARSKGKTMGANFNNRTPKLATSAISYTLRDRSLYVWPKSLMFYVTAWKRGHLTDEEMQEMLNWLNSAA